MLFVQYNSPVVKIILEYSKLVQKKPNRKFRVWKFWFSREWCFPSNWTVWDKYILNGISRHQDKEHIVHCTCKRYVPRSGVQVGWSLMLVRTPGKQNIALIRQFSKILSAYFWRASIHDFLDLLHHSFCSVGCQHTIHLISWQLPVIDTQLENRSERDPSNKRDPRHSSRKNRSERFTPWHPNRAATFP